MESAPDQGALPFNVFKLGVYGWIKVPRDRAGRAGRACRAPRPLPQRSWLGPAARSRCQLCTLDWSSQSDWTTELDVLLRTPPAGKIFSVRINTRGPKIWTAAPANTLLPPRLSSDSRARSGVASCRHHSAGVWDLTNPLKPHTPCGTHCGAVCGKTVSP